MCIFGFGKCSVLTQSAYVGLKLDYSMPRGLMQDYIRHGLDWVCQIVSGLCIIIIIYYIIKKLYIIKKMYYN